jgi:predicted nucleotidyltransferase
MTVTSLDFSRKVDLQATGELVASVSDVAERLGIHCFITGALARDLWIVHHLAVQVARQTNDVDFAIAVANWDDFHALRKGLLDSGEFRDTPRIPLHRLRHRNGIPIDLVPFGGIERAETRSIAWPPNGEFVMSVFGFREAAAQTIEVRFPGDAIGRVVTLPALAVLKVDAWADRHIRDPRKDAYDLQLIIRHYADAIREDRLYHQNPYLMGSPADYERASAWLLGKDMAQLLDSNGRERLARVIAEEADEDGQLRLAGEMMRDNQERALELLAALEDGFIGKSDEQ